MKASLLDKLETLCDRHEEVSALLGDGEIIADQAQFRDLSREYSELEAVVQCYEKYVRVKTDIEEARQMLEDADPEVREMAQEELDEGGERLAVLEAELQALLPEATAAFEVRPPSDLALASTCAARSVRWKTSCIAGDSPSRRLPPVSSSSLAPLSSGVIARSTIEITSRRCRSR